MNRCLESMSMHHFIGWNSNYIDRKDIVPRVYDVFIDGNYRGIARRQCSGLLRLDLTIFCDFVKLSQSKEGI
jgi:hypothetical protein